MDFIMPRHVARKLLISCSGIPPRLYLTPFLSSLSPKRTATTTKHSSLNINNPLGSSASAMENISQYNGADLKDQQREKHCKGECDHNSSDDLIPHILNLYGSRATPKDFEIYAQDATFEDPLTCAHGVKQIKSAFYSLPKIFSESRIVEYNVQESVISHNKKEILIDNMQYYKFLGRSINLVSLIRLYVEEGKICRHEDWWDKKPPLSRETVKVPLVGRLTEIARRGSMLAIHALMGFGKDPGHYKN